MIYEVQVSYQHANEQGKEVLCKDKFIVENGTTFGDVEKTMFDMIAGFKESDVIAIKRSKAKEIANTREHETDGIWEATVADTYLMDDGSEKTIKYKILFFSKSSDTANAFMNEYLKQGYDMTLVGIKLTPFVDII